MNWKMDLDKTSFSVDWFTPGDKRLSFPKSARISFDDFVSETRLSICYTPDDAQKRHSYSVDTVSAVAPNPELQQMVDSDAKARGENFLDDPLSSPGFLSLAGDYALCGVDVNVSCLDDLDERLLLSPVQCFTDMCWESAVDDKPEPPAKPRKTRTRSRSFNGLAPALPPPSPPFTKDYARSFDRPRPLAAKISLPLPSSPHVPPSPYTESHDTLSTFQDKPPLSYILYTDSDGQPLALPLSHGNHSLDTPRHKGKRGRKVSPPLMYIPPRPPPPPRAPSKSSNPLRFISDACSTLVRSRKKSSQ